MGLKGRIQNDTKDALRQGERERLAVLRLLNAAIKNREIELHKVEEGLDDEQVVEVISGEIKKRRDSVEQYEKAGREDLAKSESAEIDVLSHYMPEQMSEDEIRSHARGVIREIGAQSPKDMGKVMKLLMPTVKGRAEGAVVSRIVREELSAGD